MDKEELQRQPAKMANRMTNLTFDQGMRLFVCVMGVLFFAVGIWMIKDGISAQGVIDIEMRELLKGRLQTGSAGLFVTFFSFWMIMLSFLIGRKPIEAKQKYTKSLPSRMPAMITGIIIFWVVTICLYLIARSDQNQGESLLFGALSFIFFMTSIGCSVQTFATWDNEMDEKRNNAKQPENNNVK